MGRFFLIVGIAASLFAQGVATRGVRPAPRGKPSGIPFAARLVDVAEPVGLAEPVIYGGVDRRDYILETTGTGIAFLDFDNDGWLDLFVPSGTRFNLAPQPSNRLYRNTGKGKFVDVTERAGLVRGGWASGIAVADYDNDGWDDLYLTYWGQNVLYRNQGDGSFKDVTESAGLIRAGRHWGTGAAFFDYDRDGHLDLFVTYYLDFDPSKIPKPGEPGQCNWKGVAVNCGPRGLPAVKPRLYHNNGNGVFEDVTEKSGISKAAAAYGLTAVTADLDEDGWLDVYVACDSTPSQLFINQRDGTFVEAALESGLAVSDDGLEQAGMGLALGDYNRDGRLDIFKTNFADDTNNLYKNLGKRQFSEAAAKAGLAVETRFVSWGAGMPDLDNDGWPDIFYVTGHVFPELERTLPAYPHRGPRIIFRSLGEGRFEELLDPAPHHSSRGAAFGDFDNDGDLDIAIMNMNAPPSLLRNELLEAEANVGDADVRSNNSSRHWLKVRLVGSRSPRTPIGATVTAKYGGLPQVQVLLSQASYLSVNDPRLHFGLGSAKEADLEIVWPSGEREVLRSVAGNQLVTIREGKGIVKTERF
ncbi:MAG: CRTAC1 family protein [Bryobacteraceae bacterium]